MLLALMYHHVYKKGKYSNCYKQFEEHLRFITENYPTTFPGDSTQFFKVQVCLIFDDAYYDFYHFVFPLLKKYQAKCLLAIPVNSIINHTKLSGTQRLGTFETSFCTWDEIEEISQSGLVQIASHSLSHQDLTHPDADLEKEIVFSKQILEEKLQKKIDSFIYPFGKFNPFIHHFVKKHYSYIFRIGSTFNLSWKNLHQIIYRINADNLESIHHQIKKSQYPKYLVRYLFNLIRKR